jgi:hypothetical protein
MSKLSELLEFLPAFWQKHVGSNNYNFFNSFSPLLEDLSINIEGLKESIQASTASGTDLDSLGRLFNLYREAEESDLLFRSRILNFWGSYNRGGLVQNLVNVLADLLNIPTSQIDVVENEEQATVRLIGNLGNLGDGLDIPTVSDIKAKLDEIKAAGVYVDLFFSPLILETYDASYSETYTPVLIEAAIGGVLPDVYEYDGGGELI